MGKKGGNGKEAAGGNDAAEIQTEQGGTGAAPEGGAPQDGGSKKKKKKEKVFDPLSDDPVQFKKIDFENALTPEEKAAIKAEKLAAKKGGKKKKEKPPPEEKPPEPEAAPEEPKKKEKKAKAEEPKEKTGEEQEPKDDKQSKKGKKDKKAAEIPAQGEAVPDEKSEKKKGKKDKKAPTEAGAGEAAEKAAEEEKKVKGKKGKKAEEETETEAKGMKGKKKEAEAAESVIQEIGGDVEDKKGKKGKGKKGKEEGEGEGKAPAKGKKGKGKKGEKGPEPESSKLDIQMSISAFLGHYASMQMDDDEWTWESYTGSTISIVEEVPEKGKKGKGKDKEKKGKKGKGKEEGEKPEGEVAPETEEKGGKGKGKDKKGKKGKKEKEEVPEAVEDTASVATDIMAEIRKMKEMADAQALAAVQEVAEEVSVAPSRKSGKSKKSKMSEAETEAGEPAEKKEKQGPKKKLSKKERAKLAAELAEQARIQAELDAKRAEEEERIRLIEERKAAIEKEKRETAEQNLRTEQLTNSIHFIDLIKKKNINKALRDRRQGEWEQFLKCDGLPDPYVCGQMNTYLHLWEKVLKTTTIDTAAERTIEALKLLDTLTTLIDDPVGVEQSHIDNWKWLHRLFREYQQKSLDTATYRLMRDIDKNLDRKQDFLRPQFHRKEKHFALNLWLLMAVPPSMPNPRRPPPVRVEIAFPNMHMNVLFPISLVCESLAVRAMYVKYDHLSDLCTSFHKPPVPDQYQKDLYKATLEEWYSKLFYKYEHRAKPEPGSEGEPPPVLEPVIVDKEKGIIPTVPYQKLEPSASTYFIAEEDQLYLQIRDNLKTEVDEHVINLRKYTILGGIYYLNLYYQTPQPLYMVCYDTCVTRLEIPKWLSEVPFYVKYTTPPPIDPTSKMEPEAIEEEIKRQEEELDQLLYFTLTLPDHIMWLDVPTICYWDDDRKLWTTEDVHDLKHIEDKGYFTFRTSRFGCFSFASYRYTNLPFQAWELKPEADGTVTLQITAAILLIEFNIKGNLICVLQLQNSPNKALQEIVRIYYKLPKLIRILQEGGVDVFPSFDAFCYIEGTCEKHWPMEKHTYCNIAQLSSCYNFAWSRWNLTAGRRNMVMQMREYKADKVKQVPHSMLMVTPTKAVFIDCTEVSPMFNEESVEGMLFYPDLYHLMKGTTSMAMRTKVQNAPYELVGAVADILIATRILSFS